MKEFVVALRLPALEHNAAGQAGALDSSDQARPCLGANLLLLDIHLVYGILANDMLEEVLRRYSCDTLNLIELQVVEDRNAGCHHLWHHNRLHYSQGC